jgi:hypothetical protein
MTARCLALPASPPPLPAGPTPLSSPLGLSLSLRLETEKAVNDVVDGGGGFVEGSARKFVVVIYPYIFYA